MGEREKDASQDQDGKETGCFCIHGIRLRHVFPLMVLFFKYSGFDVGVFFFAEFVGAEKGTEHATLPEQGDEDRADSWKCKGTIGREKKKRRVGSKRQGKEDQIKRKCSCQMFLLHLLIQMTPQTFLLVQQFNCFLTRLWIHVIKNLLLN